MSTDTPPTAPKLALVVTAEPVTFPSEGTACLVPMPTPSLTPSARKPAEENGEAMSDYSQHAWRDRAACRDYHDPRDFFDMSAHPVQILETLRIVCDSCPVLRSCRTYVDEQEGTSGENLCHGFWAGETVKERILRRSRERRRARRRQRQLEKAS